MISNEIISKLICLDCANVWLCHISDSQGETLWLIVCEEEGLYEEYGRRHLTKDGYEWSLSLYGNPVTFRQLPSGAIRYDLTNPQDAKTFVFMTCII